MFSGLMHWGFRPKGAQTWHADVDLGPAVPRIQRGKDNNNRGLLLPSPLRPYAALRLPRTPSPPLRRPLVEPRVDHHAAGHRFEQDLLVHIAEVLGGAALLDRDGALAEFGVDDAVIADHGDADREFDIAVLCRAAGHDSAFDADDDLQLAVDDAAVALGVGDRGDVVDRFAVLLLDDRRALANRNLRAEAGLGAFGDARRGVFGGGGRRLEGGDVVVGGGRTGGQNHEARGGEKAPQGPGGMHRAVLPLV